MCRFFLGLGALEGWKAASENSKKKAFTKRKTRKITNIFIRAGEDLLKQIYYVRHRSLFCLRFFASVVSLVLLFSRLANFSFFLCYAFYVFSCYGIMLCAGGGRGNFALFTFVLVKIFTRLVTSLVHRRAVPADAERNSKYPHVSSFKLFGVCIIFFAALGQGKGRGRKLAIRETFHQR